MRERLPENGQPLGDVLDAGLQALRRLCQESQQITFRERVKSQPLSEQRSLIEGLLRLPGTQAIPRSLQEDIRDEARRRGGPCVTTFGEGKSPVPLGDLPHLF